MAGSGQKRENEGVSATGAAALRWSHKRKRYFSDSRGIDGNMDINSKRQRSACNNSRVSTPNSRAQGAGANSSRRATVVNGVVSETGSSSASNVNRFSSSTLHTRPGTDSTRKHMPEASGQKAEDESANKTKRKRSASAAAVSRQGEATWQGPHQQQRQEQQRLQGHQTHPEKQPGERQHRRQHMKEELQQNRQQRRVPPYQRQQQTSGQQNEQKQGGAEGHVPEEQQRGTPNEDDRKQRRSDKRRGTHRSTAAAATASRGQTEDSSDRRAATRSKKRHRRSSTEAAGMGGAAAAGPTGDFADGAALATSGAGGAASPAGPEDACGPKKRKKFLGVRPQEHGKLSGVGAREKKTVSGVRTPGERPSLDSCVFVRQVPETAEEEEMKKLFSKFGEVAYVKFVMNPQGERQGSAFVQFKKSEAAARAIRAASTSPSAAAGSAPHSLSGSSSTSIARAAAEQQRPAGLSAFAAEALGFSASPEQQQQEQQQVTAGQRDAATAPLGGGEGVFLRGSRLLVHAALSKEESQKLRQQQLDSKRPHREKRHNLHLAFVGMMSPSSAAFQQLPPAEQRRRLHAWQEKKAKLKNPNYSINPKRLSVRNLPTAVTVNQIREVITHVLMGSPEFAACVDSGEIFSRPAVAPAATEEEKPPQQHFSSLPSWRQRRIAEKAVPKIHISRDKSRKTATASQSLAGLQQQSSKRSRGFAFVDCCHEKVAELLLPFLGNCSSNDFSEEQLLLLHERRHAVVSGLPVAEAKRQGVQKRQRPAGGEGEEETAQREEDEVDERETSVRRDSQRARPSWRQLMVEYAIEDLRKVKIKEEKMRAYLQLLQRQREQKQLESPGGVGTSGNKAAAAASLHALGRRKKKIYSRGKRQRERRRQARLAALGGAAPEFASPAVSAVAAGRIASASPAAAISPSKKGQTGRKKAGERHGESGATLDSSSQTKEKGTIGKSDGDVFEDSIKENHRGGEGGGRAEERIKFLKTLKSHEQSRRRRRQVTRMREERPELEEEALQRRIRSLLGHDALTT